MLTITTSTVHNLRSLKARGLNAIDVTVKSAKGRARELAPTWEMVMGYKKGSMSEAEYTTRYEEILDRSRRGNRASWETTCRNADGKNGTLVFCCYCPPGDFCHRTLLRDAFAEFAREELGLDVRVVDETPRSTPPKKTVPTADTSAITSFREESFFLSNMSPARVKFEGKVYQTTEAAYQAAKTLDPREREGIRLADSPFRAKKMGRKVTLRSDWNAVREEVMFELLTQKFNHADLKAKLLATGTRPLIEGNTWNDTFWGVCRGKGQNRLGKMLMAIRESKEASLEVP